MSELRVTAYGGVNCLNYSDGADLEIPEPSVNQVQVKVWAAGVNVIDTKIRQGTSFAAKTRGEKFPWTIGYDIAGEIVKLPKKVLGFHKGEFVAGMVGFPLEAGAYSSVNNFNSSELVKIPNNVSLVQAGALPVAGLTAWQSLFDVGCLKKGETVVISAAAGGVGHIAVQLAKHAGARILAICSPNNFDFVKELGADEVADYHDDSYLHWQSEADLVLDLVGEQSGISALSLLKMNSRMVSVPTVTYQAVKLAACNMTSSVLGIVVKPNVDELKQLLDYVADGSLKVEVSKSFYLKDGAMAHAEISAGHVRGKLVLLPNGIIKRSLNHTQIKTKEVSEKE